MSHYSDFVAGGVWPLRHEDPSFDVNLRVVRYAARIGGKDWGFGRGFDQFGRITGDDGSGVTGSEVFDTHGDVLGASVWAQVRGQRPIPGWNWAWASKTVRPAFKADAPDAPDPLPSSTSTTSKPGAPSTTVNPNTDADPDGPLNVSGLPVFSASWDADARFVPKPLVTPPYLDAMPKGICGVTLTATKETNQEDVFLPGYFGLVAPHAQGTAKLGSPVFDLTEDDELDPLRRARLQALTRVYKNPKGCAKTPFGKVGDFGLAIQMGTPRGGSGGHAVFADDEGGGGATVVKSGAPGSNKPGGAAGGSTNDKPQTMGTATHNLGGPFHTGRSGDKHVLASNADGENFNSLHIDTNAKFYQNQKYDAPLDFGGAWEEPGSAGELWETFLRYDERSVHQHPCGQKEGKWRWETRVPIYHNDPGRTGGGGRRIDTDGITTKPIKTDGEDDHRRSEDQPFVVVDPRPTGGTTQTTVIGVGGGIGQATITGTGGGQSTLTGSGVGSGTGVIGGGGQAGGTVEGGGSQSTVGGSLIDWLIGVGGVTGGGSSPGKPQVISHPYVDKPNADKPGIVNAATGLTDLEQRIKDYQDAINGAKAEGKPQEEIDPLEAAEEAVRAEIDRRTQEIIRDELIRQLDENRQASNSAARQNPQNLTALMTVNEFGAPGFLFRAQGFDDNEPDLRNVTAWGKGAARHADQKFPVIARMEAVGNQTGSLWNYSDQPGTGRYGQATAGTVNLFPPNVGAEQVLNGKPIAAAPGTLFNFYTGTGLSFGTPTTNGTIKSGFTIAQPTSTTLVISPVNSSGVVGSEIFSVNAGNGYGYVNSGRIVNTNSSTNGEVPVSDGSGAYVWTNPGNLLHKGHVHGFGLTQTNPVDSPSVITVAAGYCRDSTNAYNISVGDPDVDYLSSGVGENDAFTATGVLTVNSAALFAFYTSGTGCITSEVTAASRALATAVDFAVADASSTSTMTPHTGTGTFLTSLKVGDMVGNSTFGYGTIVAVDGNSSARVTVNLCDFSATSKYQNQAVRVYEQFTIQVGATPSRHVKSVDPVGTSIVPFGTLNGGANASGLAIKIGQPPPGGMTHTDTGTRVYAIPSWIFLWARMKTDGTTSMGWSTQRTTPYTPSAWSGYSIWRRVGVLPIATDNFVAYFSSVDLGAMKLVRYEDDWTGGTLETRFINGGSSAAWTTLALTTVVPPTSTSFLATLEVALPAATNYLAVRPRGTGSTNVTRPTLVNAEAGKRNATERTLITDAAQCIDYATGPNDGTDPFLITVGGYYDVP